jgi:glyoxylase-like metal-dependent hydrolase (beta-lactamase superfamily II)
MEIVPGVHWIDGVHGNCYIIMGDGLILIDTGLPGRTAKILGYIEHTLQCIPSDITHIILTHYHLDHTGNAYELWDVSGAKVAVHAEDAVYVSGELPMPVPGGFSGALYRFAGMFFKFKPVQPDILLHDNDRIAGLTCIHCPGHTPGSICLYDPKFSLLFTGDTIRFMKGRIQGPPAGFTGNMDQARQSIRKIAGIGFDIMLAGHGGPVLSAASEKVKKFSGSLP